MRCRLEDSTIGFVNLVAMMIAQSQPSNLFFFSRKILFELFLPFFFLHSSLFPCLLPPHIHLFTTPHHTTLTTERLCHLRPPLFVRDVHDVTPRLECHNCLHPRLLRLSTTTLTTTKNNKTRTQNCSHNQNTLRIL